MLKYGSCFKTLKDVLGELSKNGLLLPHKRRYKIPSLSIRQGFTTITLVSYTVSAGDERHFKILQLLEERCSQMNITLKKVLLRKEEGKTGKLVRVGTGYYNFQERQERQKELQRGNFSFDTPEFTNTMGFIVFNMPFSAGEIASELASRFNVPIAILDQRDEYEFPSIPGTGTRIKRFTLSTTSRASTAVGRFLLSLGHRKIAYIATSHGQKWSSNRLQGLRNAWENTGTAGEVIACTCHYDAMESIPCTHVEIQAIARHLMRADIAIDKNVRTLFKKLSYNNPERIVGGLMREQYYEKLFGLFQQAYSYPDVTAWVAANDEIALHALGFLTRKRIKVPDDVSLVGFDDSLKANMSDLTSYNFNHTAIVQGILQHMMEPRAQVLRHKPEEQIEMEGFLVERGSTAKPRTTFFEHK